MQVAEGDLGKIDVTAIARPPWFVPDIRPLSEQLKAFRRRKTHFALAVDEYGEVMGLITLEDILEEIVGDISDEYDVAVPGVRPQPDGSVNIDGGYRSAISIARWNGTCPTTRRPQLPVSSSMRRARFPSPAKPSRFMVFASACFAAIAIASPPCGSRRWYASRRQSWLRQSSLALDPPAGRSRAGFARRRGVDGERMHAAFKLSDKCLVDHPVTLEPALPAERLRHDIYPEMSFPALSMSGMPDVLVGFVDHVEARGAKALVNFR